MMEPSTKMPGPTPLPSLYQIARCENSGQCTRMRHTAGFLLPLIYGLVQQSFPPSALREERIMTALAAPGRLYLLPLSYVAVPMPGGSRDMVSGCYLIQTGDKHILIDSGSPDDVQPPPGMPPFVNQRTVL